MSAHQVVIGALNPCENCYSIGSIDGINFIACAVGADVVILASNFERIQVITGSSYKTEEIVNSVNCCGDSGKISVCYGNIIRILEPISLNGKSGSIFSYRWNEVNNIVLENNVDNVQWVLDGLRLLVLSGFDLFLYQHKMLSTVVNPNSQPESVKFSLAEDAFEKISFAWEIIWQTKLSAKVKYVKFSSDGALFATCGEEDRFVKIWYQQKDSYAFSFIYIQHPAPVCGLEWRLSGRYMPRKYVQNALITWCEDNTSRIWKEIPNRESPAEFLIEAAEVLAREKHKRKRFSAKSFHIKKAKTRLTTKLSHLINDKRNSRTHSLLHTNMNCLTRSSTLADFAIPVSANTVVFSLAATINAENDCFLVPTMSPFSHSKRPFTVHWLNNKELIFTNGAERILAEALLNEQPENISRTGVSPIPPSMISSSSSADFNDASNIETDTNLNSTMGATLTAPNTSTTLNDAQVDRNSAKDVLDVKLEGLLRQWHKTFDVLFSVHPVDGSLLTWTVEWLDDPWHQATVSFASRFPDAFPITDASSLNLSLSTFNPHDPAYSEVLRRQNHTNDTSHPECLSLANLNYIRKRFNDRSQLNTILLLTSHENGSLNLWRLAMDESRNFSTIFNIVHESRMCGHRFHISQVVAHPVLPLLLTASQFTHNNSSTHSAAESELILWKVAPVGPLCKTGGIRELARITTNSSNAFTYISWISATLPSFILGSVCNSPSSCFVASNNGKLCLYQAIVDAGGLLTQLHSKWVNSRNSSSSSLESDISKLKHNYNDKIHLNEAFKVVSMQSTAKPGCVLYIGDIMDSEHISNEIILLHIFDENLAVSNYEEKLQSNLKNSNKRSQKFEITFSNKYLIVMVVRTPSKDYIRMWSLTVDADRAVPIFREENNTSSLLDKENMFYPAAEPIYPSAAKLSVKSEKVYDEPIDFGEEIRVRSCVVSAGHLSSSSLYPACKTPYTLLFSCSDDQIRFLRCVSNESTENNNFQNFSWEKWKMVNEETDSSLEMDGRVYSVSSAYSGRFACAYKNGGAIGSRQEDVKNLELSIYECESSGGVEWLCEDTFNLDNFFAKFSSITLSESINKFNFSSNDYFNTVRIDWVSAEDGSHILTVGIRHLIYLFAQVSQNTAQNNIVMMKEHDSSTRKRSQLRKSSSLVGSSLKNANSRLVRWTCIRTLELQSANGLPPLSTAMSWVRDGLLIVGMNSEMRVYNQWNLITKTHAPISNTHKNLEEHKIRNSTSHGHSLNISRSHSMLEQLNRKPGDHLPHNKILRDIMNKVLSFSKIQDLKDDGVLEAISEEGLFEAARLANPILPQYHPKQLIEMLNAGKTKRVKAILLHVLRTLKQRQVAISNPLSRAASVRKMTYDNRETSMDQQQPPQRRASVTIIPLDENNADYDELNTVSPLPLYLLFGADNCVTGNQKADNINTKEEAYEKLFNEEDSDEDLDQMLDNIQNADTISRKSFRTRHSSISSEFQKSSCNYTNFTTKHSRILTELLTHTHLPGLSSVDQMHLLAIADTISQFSSNVMDKLAHANASLKSLSSTMGDSTTAGYSNPTIGTETVDECGLRFLMAMKQHEYLLLCLPLKQRKLLKERGISTVHIIWAFHSDTEMELLKYIPCWQKNQANWDELRAFGVAWWIRTPTTLQLIVDNMAKQAFQKNQDPMDASLYYLALRKKNVLMHLFKSINDSRMYDFFREDFTQPKWKRAALKNAFALMSKQRFLHAAAFFLLGDSLKDALQTILDRLNDLQLALVIVRIYETDVEKQAELIKELLCREVLGCRPDAIKNLNIREVANEENNITSSPKASRDPFERSMAFWLIKEYAHAASTLVEEASKDNIQQLDHFTERLLSDIFNFYAFLRKHPLVVRQRLTHVGIQLASTEQFLVFAKEMESRVTPSERRLYFRTAATHMASGCPLLALDVLSRLPKKISSILQSDSESNEILKKEALDRPAKKNPASINRIVEESVDWSAPTPLANDELELKWSDEEDENPIPKTSEFVKNGGEILIESSEDEESDEELSPNTIDFIAQHLKFIAILRIMMDEMSTLASGFEIDGGQLRFELFKWLERECAVLRDTCDFHLETKELTLSDEEEHFEHSGLEDVDRNEQELPLHVALKMDRINLKQRIKYTLRRRNWLTAHQKLLRTLTSYCALHSAQNYRLISIQMELLLLLLEVQRDAGNVRYVEEPVPDIHSFPLLASSMTSSRMFVISPLHFVQNQSIDILLTISELKETPTMEIALPKMYMLYNLCQGLSSCVYQSLSNIDQFLATGSSTTLATTTSTATTANNEPNAPTGILTYRMRGPNLDSAQIKTLPSKWPGVDGLVALLAREKDDDVPNLRLLLVECFIAVTMSLFCYSLTIYDSRWLYRLMAHPLNEQTFAILFGGGCERRLRSSVPIRPPPPNRNISNGSKEDNVSGSSFGDYSAAIRAKLHAKVFRVESFKHSTSYHQSHKSLPTLEQHSGASEQIISCWVPPSKHIFQFYAEKVEEAKNLGYDGGEDFFDSDEESVDEEEEGEAEEEEDALNEDEDDSRIGDKRPHDCPNSYAWLLIRLASMLHMKNRLTHFLFMCGFDFIDIATIAPRLENIFKILDGWITHLEEQLDAYPDGCPEWFLRNMDVNSTSAGSVVQTAPLLRKYRVLIEVGNTPFEYEAKRINRVKRLWKYLIKQEHLSAHFIKYIFGRNDAAEVKDRSSTTASINGAPTTNPLNGLATSSVLTDSIKIIQREHEPIIAFACNSARPGCIVVSTGRELQEISLERVMEEREILSAKQSTSSFLNNRVELDIALQSLQKDTLRDNDDYQLITENNSIKGRVQGSSYITSFIVDRSRVALQKLRKRLISGIRRLEAHSSLPYYVSGSSDGSILLWEWGVDLPLFTARAAGQYAKVSKLAFALNGNKFAAVDGDGLLCIWQASKCMTVRKPFFNQKCHSKSATDVKFLGQTSSLLVTAGHSTGDQNVVIWDTLMPQTKCMVHSFVGHQDGANCVAYLANSQSIISGGQHGELCIWDIRQRQLRSIVKTFDTSAVRSLTTDPNSDIIVVGSSEGDIKIWSSDLNPQLLCTLNGEHASRGGFSLRQVGSSSIQGVQQLYVDPQLRLFSCGADNSLKFRTLPSHFS